MPDNYTRGSETFRAKDTAGIKSPVIHAGAHVRTYKGVESVTVTDTGIHNLVVPSGATFADVVMEGAAATDYVRCWHGASDPSSGVGVKLFDGQALATAAPGTLTFIKGSTGAGGVLRVEYYSYE